ncbi:MAG: 2-hydroxyacid dehydrogenase, partial [Anaerolineae bacterium]|nr:2-hydroxyacid dehydrogenase [Anaerolineae bacterium]
MKVAFFSTKSYDRTFFDAANIHHELVFFEPRLTLETAPLARGFAAVCAFVNDQLGDPVLHQLAEGGVKLIALLAAGFNNVDLSAAARLGLTIMRVPAYSPYAVAEHTAALILALNRKIYKAYDRVRDGNLSLDGLLGFDLYGSTVGIIGTGKIGAIVARIMHGFGCHLLAHDIYHNPDCLALGVRYVSTQELFAGSDIITLHSPLSPQTYHLIDENALRQMKNGVMLINTSRGALIDTLAVIEGLKSGKVGFLG